MLKKVATSPVAGDRHHFFGDMSPPGIKSKFMEFFTNCGVSMLFYVMFIVLVVASNCKTNIIPKDSVQLVNKEIGHAYLNLVFLGHYECWC